MIQQGAEHSDVKYNAKSRTVDSKNCPRFPARCLDWHLIWVSLSRGLDWYCPVESMFSLDRVHRQPLRCRPHCHSPSGILNLNFSRDPIYIPTYIIHQLTGASLIVVTFTCIVLWRSCKLYVSLMPLVLTLHYTTLISTRQNNNKK